MKTPKAIIYTRVSTPGQAQEGTSLVEQEAVCLRKAQELGAEVVDIISDEGISGAFYLSRPGIQKALSRTEAGEASLLITMKLDRSGRDVDALRLIRKRVTLAGGKLVFADGMNFENNAVGNLLFTQLAGFAEFEKEIIRERTMSGRRRLAEQGQQPCRTQSPIGYHIVTKEDVLRGEYAPELLGTYQIVPEQAQIVRELFTRCARGESLRKLAKWLQASRVPTQRGGLAWYPSTVRYVLSNPTYKGQPVFGRFQWRTDETRIQQGFKAAFARPGSAEEQVTLSCEPLIDSALWETCQHRMVENPFLFSGPPTRRHLLIGLLRCPECGRCMATDTTKSKVLYYRCPESRPSRSITGRVCTRTMYRGEVVEGLILRDIRRLAKQPERFAGALRTFQRKQKEALTSPGEPERLRRELADLTAQEEATAKAQVEAVAKGRSTAVYERLLDDIDGKRKAIEDRLAALGAVQPVRSAGDFRSDGERIAEVLRRVDGVLSAEELTPAEKHIVLAGFIKAIRPEGEGYSVELRNFANSAQGVDSVQMISIQ